ncbi:MAG TPA: RIP metalloprotease RseP, partial [Candidatus Eisenbacteria bacterium]
MHPNELLPGVALLGLVIFVHELGHFLAAKWRGVKVLRFSLGFGPALARFTRGETEYRLSWFPLGGYVQMAGDTPSEDGAMPGSPREFLSHSWLGRIAIAFAGPLANLVTAYIVLVIVAVTGESIPDFPNRLGAVPDTSVAYRLGAREGDQVVAVAGTPVKSWIEIDLARSHQPAGQPLGLALERTGRRVALELSPADRDPFFAGLRPPRMPAVVGGVMTGMPAYRAGLQIGDRIVAVDGRPIAAWDELPPLLRGAVDTPVRLTIEREGRRLEITVTPMNATGGKGKTGMIGIEPPPQQIYVQRFGLLESFGLAAAATVDQVTSVYAGMWLVASRFGYYREYVGGPMFIVQAAGEQARHGGDYYLRFLAMMNIAIMAFNLLP